MNKKQIPNFADYIISDNGDIYSFKHLDPTRIKPFPQATDYLYINLYNDEEKLKKTLLVHKIVMDLFGPPSPGKDYVITHIDKDKSNNHISNLRWIHKSLIHQDKAIPIKATNVETSNIKIFRTLTHASTYFETYNAKIKDLIRTNNQFKGFTFEEYKK